MDIDTVRKALAANNQTIDYIEKDKELKAPASTMYVAGALAMILAELIEFEGHQNAQKQEQKSPDAE